MSDNRNLTNIGEQILDSVTEALNSGDLEGLSDLVAETVSSALIEARKQALREKERKRDRVLRQYDDWQRSREERERRDRERREEIEREQERRRQELQRKQVQWRQERREQSILEAQAKQAARTPKQIARDVRTMVKTKKIGSVSSVLLTVFGSFGVGISVFSILVTLFKAIVGGSLLTPLIWTIVGLPFLAMVICGAGQRARLNRAEKYIQICGYKMYGMTEEIAKQMGKSIKYIRRDLRKMLKKGFFPEGHMDAKETCFMLNDTVYYQYEQAEAAYRQAEAEANRPKTAEELAAEEQRARDAELNSMIAEGADYTRKLRELNDDIPGEEISRKLYQMENILNEIFAHVREHPDQMHRMHKLMDYYLPTTLKLVTAYKEFSNVSVPGEDIVSAMAEIDKTLDIINQAFKELLNELFQDDTMDVTTDAQVLQTMLAREGLTREIDTSPFSAGEQETEKVMTAYTEE